MMVRSVRRVRSTVMVSVGQEGQVDRDGQGRSGCPKISRGTYPSQGYISHAQVTLGSLPQPNLAGIIPIQNHHG